VLAHEVFGGLSTSENPRRARSIVRETHTEERNSHGKRKREKEKEKEREKKREREVRN